MIERAGRRRGGRRFALALAGAGLAALTAVSACTSAVSGRGAAGRGIAGAPGPGSSPATGPSATGSARGPGATPSARTSARSGPATGTGTICDYTRLPAATPDQHFVGLPPTVPLTAAVLTLVITIAPNPAPTPVVVTLDPRAPCAVSSAAFLAGAGFFAGTACDQLVTSGSYRLECGDPGGSGQGGPGYEFAAETGAGAAYPAGTVALVGGGAGTVGSRFFVVTKDSPAGALPPHSTVFGHVLSGMAAIEVIAAAGSDHAGGPGSGHPTLATMIVSASAR